MSNHKGYIYILTNPSFQDYVKIGYADDVNKRLKQLNRSECTPFAFRVYATYEVDIRLTDMKIHDVIDKLNPDLRSIDTVNGKKRVREFYAISPEDAYDLFYAMAQIHGTESKLVKWALTEESKKEETDAKEISQLVRNKAKAFTFSSCNMAVGEKLTFEKTGNEHNGSEAVIVDDKHVEYDNQTWTLTGLASYFIGKKKIAGPDFFKYKGRWLNDIRREKGLIHF